MTTKILVLASNPQGTGQLRLNQEIREVEEALKGSESRERFPLRSKVAVRVKDLQSSLIQEKPRIVHFCGHGMGSQGLVLETTSGQQQFLGTQAIADLFKLFADQIECVVLNACYSEVQAAEINQHINYVIGTKREIRDDAAIAFSQGFYEALGNGKSIEEAYEFGCNRIQLEIYNSDDIDRKGTPVVPAFSEADSNQLIELPQHEVLRLLKKAPLNTINESLEHTIADEKTIKERPFVASSPYRGLNRFYAKNKELFFGRDRLIYEVIEAIEQNNLVLLLGASGSGKSSVIRAGVIPKLESLQGDELQSLQFTPDRDPFESFYSSLLNSDYGFSQQDAEIVREGKKDTLTNTIESLKKQHSQWLIFVDQFEELFTICSNPDKRTNFIEGLIHISRDRNKSVKIILAMRSDFFEQLNIYPRFLRIAEKNRHWVSPMQPSELRLAIAKPAAKQGVVFESGLVEEIIQQVQGQAGSLPLLQYTLDLLWKADDLKDRILNIETYRRLGGVSGALQKHVDQIYKKLPEEQKLATKHIFLGLVDVVELEKSEIRRTAVSKRANIADFTAQTETVNLLVKESLLVSNESTVEIAHEALLTSWRELKDWISDARNTISLRRRLLEDANHWQELRKDNRKIANEDLWSGSKLEKVIELRKDGTFETLYGGLSPDADSFIDASMTWRDRQIQKEREAIQKELETAKELAKATEAKREAEVIAKIEAEKREREQKEANEKLRKKELKLKFYIDVATFLGMSAAFFAAIMLYLSLISQEEAQLAELKLNATTIQRKLDANNKLENLIAAIQLVGDNQKINRKLQFRLINGFKSKIDLVDEVYSSLYQAVEVSREKARFSSDQEFKLIAISQNGRYIVTLDDTKTIKIWGVDDSNESLQTFEGLKTLEKMPTSIAISNDRQRIVVGNPDSTIQLWEVNNQNKPLKIFGGDQDYQNPILSVAISNDGKQIASGSRDRTIKLWDVNNENKLPKTFGGEKGHEASVLSVAISDDNNFIVSGSADHKIKLWKENNQNEPLKTFEGHEASVLSVAISDDDNYIVSGSGDKTIKLWDAKDLKQHQQPLLYSFQGYEKKVNSVAINNSSDQIVSVNMDKTIRLWERRSKILHNTFEGNKEVVKSLAAYSNGGKDDSIIGVNVDTPIKLWDVKENQEILFDFNDHEAPVTLAAISQNGKYIVSVSDDNTIKIWNLANQNQPPHIFKGFQDLEEKVDSVAISNDANYIVTGSTDSDENHTIKLWNANNDQLIDTFGDSKKEVNEEEVNSVAISNDVKYIVSGSSDKTVRLWKVNNDLFPPRKDNEPILLPSHDKLVNSVAISEDSKYIVSGSNDKTVRLFGVESQQLLHTFNARREGEVVQSVAISQNGKYIVGSSGDKKVFLWEGTDWKNLLEIGCERIRLNSLLVSPKKDTKDTSDNIPEAANTCMEYGSWNNSEKADFLVRQGLALAEEKADLDGAKTKFQQAEQLDPSNVNMSKLETEAKSKLRE